MRTTDGSFHHPRSVSAAAEASVPMDGEGEATGGVTSARGNPPSRSPGVDAPDTSGDRWTSMRLVENWLGHAEKSLAERGRSSVRQRTRGFGIAPVRGHRLVVATPHPHIAPPEARAPSWIHASAAASSRGLDPPDESTGRDTPRARILGRIGSRRSSMESVSSGAGSDGVGMPRMRRTRSRRFTAITDDAEDEVAVAV